MRRFGRSPLLAGMLLLSVGCGVAIARSQTASQPSQSAAGDRIEALRRAPLVVTAYDLDVHLQPARHRLGAVARLRLRNDGAEPLRQIALEISSTLHWDAVSETQAGSTPKALHLEQRPVDTDTDHTGTENEAIVTLLRPLAPGATAELTTLYSGTVAQATTRLTRSGVSVSDALATDWDAVAEGETALRGFGNVLWYPVIAPPIFLGDGARLTDALGEQRRRMKDATARLRLTVEYSGPAPRQAFFCGRPAPLESTGEPEAAAEGEAGGVATAEFPAATLGFGSPSLFVPGQTPAQAGHGLTVLTSDAAVVSRLGGAAAAAAAVVEEWLGTPPERSPFLVDHPGQPFAQGALLVESADDAAASFPMVHLLSHAEFSAKDVWLDEGVAQFLPVVATERERGRAAALAALEDQRPALVLAESNVADAGDKGEPLATAHREILYRNKAVAVLWMLRGVAGDDALRRALTSLRSRPLAERDSKAFEAALEAASHKDLGWFFADWVFADRGLPDLRIVTASAHPEEGRQGVTEGTLVAIEVHNDGLAAAEVPVTVRSGELTATERLRVPGKSSASTRILFQGTPEEVSVNDGSVPEQGSSRHVRVLKP